MLIFAEYASTETTAAGPIVCFFLISFDWCELHWNSNDTIYLVIKRIWCLHSRTVVSENGLRIISIYISTNNKIRYCGFTYSSIDIDVWLEWIETCLAELNGVRKLFWYCIQRYVAFFSYRNLIFPFDGNSDLFCANVWFKIVEVVSRAIKLSWKREFTVYFIYHSTSSIKITWL